MLDAYEAGKAAAIEEFDNGSVLPDEEQFIVYICQQDILFSISGEKLDPEAEDSLELLTDYERGYFDFWDDTDN